MKSLMVSLIIFALIGCGAFVNGNDVINAVEKQGYSNVTVVDKSIFFISFRGCGESDSAVFKLEATNAIGKRVNLLACAGWPFKGVTIRTR